MDNQQIFNFAVAIAAFLAVFVFNRVTLNFKTWKI